MYCILLEFPSKAEIIALLWTWLYCCLLLKCSSADQRQNNTSILLCEDVSRDSRQEMIRIYESVLDFSLPVSRSRTALHRRHPPGRADTSVWCKPSVMVDGNASALAKYSKKLPFAADVMFSLPRRTCLFTLSYPHLSRVVAKMRWAHTEPLVRRQKATLKEIIPAPSCTWRGSMTPL